jgi:hypothetical protein
MAGGGAAGAADGDADAEGEVVVAETVKKACCGLFLSHFYFQWKRMKYYING